MANKKTKKRPASKLTRKRQMQKVQRFAQLNRQRALQQEAAAQGLIKLNNPKKLAALCREVIKKYKINTRKDDKIEDFIVVGGKPLRRRKQCPSTSELKISQEKPQVKPKKKKLKDKGLKNPVKSSFKKHKDTKEALAMLSINPEPALRIKVERDLAHEEDPLCPEEFMIEIKEEPLKHETKFVTTPRAEAPTLEVPSLIVKPAPSTSVSNYPLATVVMDDLQIFANRVADQLRAMPVSRALLLQVEIQCMIDNEKQLLLDEQ